jgi:hypothetical protein
MQLKAKLLKGLKWTIGITMAIVIGISVMLYVFQDKICNLVLSELGKEFKEPVYFSRVDLTFWSTFPNLTVNVHDVKVHDAFKTNESKKLLLQSDRIRLVFNPIDLWRENYHIKVIEIGAGELNVRTALNGDVNYLILNSSVEKEESKYDVKISSVSTKDFQVNYLNSKSHQYYTTKLSDMLFSGDFNQDAFNLNARGNMLINRLQSGKVALLQNKPVTMDLLMNVNTKEGTFSLPKTSFKLARIPFTVSGNYGVDSMRFEVKAEELTLTDLVNNLSLDDAEKELSRYKGSGSVGFDLSIYGSTKNQSAPNIACNFNIANGHLIEPVKHTQIKNLRMKGSFSSDGNPERDHLVLNHLAFETAAGPFHGELDVLNFSEPLIQGNAKGTLDLSIANRMLKNEFIHRIDGIAKVNSDFSLRISDEVAVKKMNGAISLYNVWFQAVDDHRTFEDINGKFSLKGSDLTIDAATLAINRTDLRLNGRFSNVFNYLSDKGPLSVDCAINSHQIIVEDLGRTTKAEKKESKGKEFVLPDNISGQITLNAKSITYESHTFEEVSGPIIIQERLLSFPKLSVRNAGADITGTMKIQEFTPERLEISTTVQTNNVYFGPFFKEWNDFDQEVIRAHQISGRAQIALDFYAPFNLIGGIDLNQMEVTAHMKVFNGHLKNVESLSDVAASLKTNAGKLLIGKKNLDQFQEKMKDIAFSTLENTLQISRGVISIPNMNISSSAMDMELSGTHGFDNKIDYRMKFDFRDLLGADRDSEFGTVIDDETGMKIFLRMYGDLDNPTIEWDKSSRKQELKEQLAQEKETVKSILKAEFGVFKKDTSVMEYKHKVETKEVVKINFKETKSDKPVIEAQKLGKEGKLKNTLNQWKQQQNEANVTVTVRKG